MGQTYAYFRVSSKAQDLGMQAAAVNKAAAARGDKIEVVVSEKASAKTLARPELDRLRDLVRKGEVSKLYVYRLDRLTRTGIVDTLNTVKEFRSYGCELITIADGFDLNGPAAEIVLACLSWSAQMERLAINERIAAARDRVASEGGSWGRPTALTKDQQSTILQMRQNGVPVPQIATELGVAKYLVYNLLKKNKVNPLNHSNL